MAKITVLLLMLFTNESEQHVISIAQGKIRGIQRDGYISYLGIPYASISGVNGRFKRAGLAPVWTNIRESNEPHCYTSSPVEECLQLDVHVPFGSAMPVMVWVAGGSGQYNPTLLVKRGIIVVIVRHRLGPMGFLCSSEDKIPGNAGIKDIVVALRWVRDNIVAFYGNPNKVVVAGQSFGAAMVESLMLTPMARGLFHGIILQSGTILAPWAFNFDAEIRANFLKMSVNESSEPLTRAGIADLSSLAEDLELPYLPFGICIEKSFKNEERFLDSSPHDIISTGITAKVPILMGYNNNEAYVFSSLLKEAKVLRRISKGINFLLPIELQSDKRDMSQILKKINDMYFDGTMTMSSILAYHRDAYFLGHIHKSVRMHAASNPVYYYQFSYLGNVGVEGLPGMMKTGAAHSDELAYLFPEKGRILEGDDGVVQDNIIRLWTNFVKHLNPNVDNEYIVWEPVNSQEPRVLDINVRLEMIEFPYKREAQMWEDIYEKYYYESRRYSV
ncbi:unnamed protein product [Euphydryas editha]|uniref:Carboxylesterase type B domain-containing protein n=1 Tax=Euphydryas editha TaxID=104508 RepID=A0AAU9U7W6_EUPED|nr:unnamed protein product [Euphydryas editha]